MSAAVPRCSPARECRTAARPLAASWRLGPSRRFAASRRHAQAVALLCVLVTPAALSAQDRPELRVEWDNGVTSRVQVSLDRGYAAVELDVFEELGWSVAEADGRVTLGVANEIDVSLRVDSPFFRWDGMLLQLTDPPYRDRDRTLVPLQLVTDFFPRRLPDLYAFDGSTSTLTVVDPRAADRPAVIDDRPSTYEGVRVVVIDAGHGGVDPGAMGPRGIREKNVALGIATRLADILRDEPGIEVHMTRDDDTFVEIWDRGQVATDLKADRAGVFVSIHANSFPTRRATRGFETYFLAEARTEHERRVAAIENAPISVRGQDVDPDEQPDLGFILRELRNLDHQHWSALLAEFVQDELDVFHPGPNRGVKQGVLAVLTNALMPSVLVEVGYLSNDDEGRLLGDETFQAQSADAIARAVVRFFGRYPPGSGLGGSGEGE